MSNKINNDYPNRYYKMTVQESNDALTVHKFAGSDWCSITMETNASENGRIVIRSREMAEQLHFMLGQMMGNI